MQILSLLADALIEIHEQVLADDQVRILAFCLCSNYHSEVFQLESLLQDSEWEDAEADDFSNDENLLHSVNATSLGRHTNEYLQVMAKVYDEVCLKHNAFDLARILLMYTSSFVLLLLVYNQFEVILILLVYLKL